MARSELKLATWSNRHDGEHVRCIERTHLLKGGTGNLRISPVMPPQAGGGEDGLW
jgi:hypothetical protein